MASGMVANVGLSRVVEMASINAAQARSLWLSMNMVKEGLGGGNEVVGGLWMLIVSVAVRQARLYPSVVCVVGGLAGFSGIVSTVPALGGFGALFGVLSIIWFMGLGVVMLREAKRVRAERHGVLK